MDPFEQLIGWASSGSGFNCYCRHRVDSRRHGEAGDSDVELQHAVVRDAEPDAFPAPGYQSG